VIVTNFAFDHAIIAVADLEPALADYRALGFNAFYGGQHADGQTHNGLVVFADGSYLELLAPVRVDFLDTLDTVDLSSFLHFVVRGDGWAGYALLVDDIAAAAAEMQGREVAASNPVANGRKRPDGVEIAWRTVSVGNSRTPFFITDDTPRTLRVPDDPDKTAQPNGVTGVDTLVVAVRNLARGIEHYEALLGQTAQAGSPVAGAETADFALSNFTLTLAAPDDYDSPLTPHLEKRGEAPYEIRLKTSETPQLGLLNLKQSHGARIELVAT
jgi:catechol 2,3-dioxygenase-like lactoylglutathione lyase family enzyme